MQGGEQPVDGRGLALPVGVVVADPPGGGQHPGHVQQLPGVQHAALVGPCQRRGDVLHAGEGRAAVEAQPFLGRVRLVQQMGHRVRVGGGPQVQTPLLGRLAGGLGGQPLQHRRQLQCPYGFFK